MVDSRFPTELPTRLNIDTADIWPFFKGPFKSCVLGHADLVAELPRYLKIWGWKDTVESFLEFWFETDSSINESVMQLARILRASGIDCVVASTQEAYRAAYLEAKLLPSDIFSQCFFSCDVGMAKPDSCFYEYVQLEVSANPEEILLLDDDERNIVGARSAGWKAESYQSGKDLASICRTYAIPLPATAATG